MPSEKETVVIQRRGIYTAREIKKGEELTREMVVYLRPAVTLRPPEISEILGKKAVHDIEEGKAITYDDFE